MSERPPCEIPEDIFAFPSEAETGTAASAAAADVDHTLLFPSESAPLPFAEASVPSSSEADALMEFAPDTGRPKITAPQPTPVPVARVDEPRAFDRLRPIIVRWALPTAAAFAIGVLGTLISLRERDAIRADASDAARPAIFDPSIAPGIVSGMFQARYLQSLPQIDVQPLAAPQPSVAHVETRQTLSTPPPAPLTTLAATQRSLPPGTRGNATRTLAASTPRPLAVEAPPIESIPLAARVSDLPDAIVVSPPRSGIPAEAPGMTSRDDEFGVRRALLSYVSAYENLNVAAAAEVWPNVDRTALSRAFAALKSQGIDFQSCSITVRDRDATAYCRGTYQYVRKVGNPTPLLAEQQWVFKMRRAGNAWKIDDVSASQDAVLAAQQTGGKG